ncbi:MoaD/ThiS family protein [Chitinolyticbacter meiyuanensis]|uniref:MoaD/ThiS family protein n=1 Tax=Chitinolyticbacter meiyuanensis TaxID=682798 RepID=UPI0011E592EC|nr:MoaD/ThiS family protein [Chitinolyticbacter meiyuanensis]
MKTLHLVYFARLREAFGCSGETVSTEAATAAALVAELAARGGAWAEELAGQRLFRLAINQEMAQQGDPLPDGAEVALFPPVTGG